VIQHSKARYLLLQEYEGDQVVSNFLRVYLQLTFASVFMLSMPSTPTRCEHSITHQVTLSGCELGGGEVCLRQALRSAKLV
ncbi:hypothetical protein BDN67DRAFT_917409, partial [Paxillus ammoniavirescens]